MIKSAVKLAFFISVISGCSENNQNFECDFTDFKYYQGQPLYLGEMADEYILVGSDSSNSDSSIKNFVKSNNYFDQDYILVIEKLIDYRYKQVALKFKTNLNCKAITKVITDINKNKVIDFAHFTIETEYCTNLIGDPIGEKCVYSYSSLFYIKVKDPSNLSDLDNTIAETSTVLIEQHKFTDDWFTLEANKNSKGDAMQMANYFYETGLFEASEADIITIRVN